MNAIADGQTFVIAQRFDKVLKLIRSALAEAELSVAGEFDSTEGLNGELGKKAVRSRILLVDCPLLVFEALALDRASAVFFPFHILVSAAGDQTQVSAINPAGLFDARLPVGAAEPMEKLHARVALALELALLRSTESNY
jgi:uncharacterized protein (DUF302 family)